MTITDLTRLVPAFRRKLDHVKRDLRPQHFEWYRYDSLANVDHIEQLLTGANRDLTHVLLDKPVLDIGCADGDFAFFLEAAGCQVTVVDYPFTNHNHMAGVRALKQALNSSIEILTMDVDSQFQLPEQDYGLALVLGAIYHLKNPFYVLETVSKRSRTLIASTRIARHLPGVKGSSRDVPLAYLLGDRELNLDQSNYWIFTESGFRRLLDRSNWDVLDLVSLGDTKRSDPIHPNHDERAFCFARSRYAMANVDLLQGWHADEGNGWRWTEQRFAIRIRVPQGSRQAALRMKVYVPSALLDGWGSLTIHAKGAPADTYRQPGNYDVLLNLGPRNGAIEVEFSLDRAVPPDARDDRERGIIVHSIEVV